jgi:hypothetical protein
MSQSWSLHVSSSLPANSKYNQSHTIIFDTHCHHSWLHDILSIWEAESLLSVSGHSDSTADAPSLICAVMLAVPAICPFDCKALHKSLPFHLPCQRHSCAIYLITAWPHSFQFHIANVLSIVRKICHFTIMLKWIVFENLKHGVSLDMFTLLWIRSLYLFGVWCCITG